MGKGDKKTRRGKIFAGSYGKTRPRPKGQAVITSETKPIAEKPAKKRTPKVVKSAPAPEPQAEETIAAVVPTVEENAPEIAAEAPMAESSEAPAEETPAPESEVPAEEHPADEGAAPAAEVPAEEAATAE